ncbi:serine/threonine protein kinase [Brevibacterium jeotgali]|uniref:Protein kinase domain-containing protein n=1 Tax=Brevibacterium jeotgali TaxID=1262550 RepID=A0A2H1L2K9_9MICO|nr:protein kinase [Brevibacterium jeotgali]TWC02343.1 protein kinase-like protein [Brevibacterium jeotgali]SMY11136.1 Protein kinase domain-containing protein [Brevibacterium jeotgali]
MLPAIPFNSGDVEAAFPELCVVVPHLGQGAFKVAFKAFDCDEPLVLKIIYAHPLEREIGEFDLEHAPERIAREIAGMSSIDCPNVVRLKSKPVLRQIGSARYLAYEEPFYGGSTLDQRLAGDVMDRKEVRRLMVGLLRASKALWDSGEIVHRDIKPSNVAFDEAGEPVLLDLGIALFGGMSAITATDHESPRTPLYAAPEQFELRRNVQIDFRTDQYSIALTVLEAAIGAHPIYQTGMREAEYFRALENFDPSILESFQLDSDVREVIGRMLSRRSYGRYRSPNIPLELLGAA